MPRYAVHPDDLVGAGDLTAADEPALEVVRRLVATAVDQALAALAAETPLLSAAVAGYGRVEGAVATTLGEAAGILAGALSSAASAYAATDSAAGTALVTAAGDGSP